MLFNTRAVNETSTATTILRARVRKWTVKKAGKHPLHDTNKQNIPVTGQLDGLDRTAHYASNKAVSSTPREAHWRNGSPSNESKQKLPKVTQSVRMSGDHVELLDPLANCDALLLNHLGVDGMGLSELGERQTLRSLDKVGVLRAILFLLEHHNDYGVEQHELGSQMEEVGTGCQLLVDLVHGCAKLHECMGEFEDELVVLLFC